MSERIKHPNSTIAGCGFHHIAIRTAGWERCLQFYTESLGFHPTLQWGEAPRRAALLDVGDGNYLEVFERDPLPAGEAGAPAIEAPILHLCFRADNCDEAIERARAAGVEVTVEPKSLELGGQIPVRIAFFKGPDGEIVEFFQNQQL